MENSSENYFRYLFKKYNVDIKIKPEIISMYLNRASLWKDVIFENGRNQYQEVKINLDDFDKVEVSRREPDSCLMQIDDRKCFVCTQSYWQTKDGVELTISIN